MSLKTILSAGIIGLAGLALSGCVTDPYYYDYPPYYDDYPLYRGGYYSGGVVIYDSGPRVRPRHPRPRHVERPHRPRWEHRGDHRPRISTRGPDRSHQRPRWQDAAARSPDRRFDRNWRDDDRPVWIMERSGRP